MITDAEIEEGLKLCQEVTEGPWEWRNRRDFEILTGPGFDPNDAPDFKNFVMDDCSACGEYKKYVGSTNANGRFIAAARTLLPKALEEIKRLRHDWIDAQMLINRLRADVERLQTTHDYSTSENVNLRAENEKLKHIAEAAFNYWNDVKDPMPHGAELYEALKARRGWK